MRRYWLALLHETLGRVDRPQEFRGPFPKRPRFNDTTQHNLSVQGTDALTSQTFVPTQQKSVKTIPHERKIDSALLLGRRGSAPIPSAEMDAGRRSGVEITESLLRKRAEHNDGRLDTLEEISLHQQNLTGINRILGKRCYNLKILYLHENRIRRLENLHRLEELKYLNLALNQIEEVKGLENCRSLAKLDLTANCLSPSKLHSIARLAANKSLKHLFLLGNPCTKKQFYRAFVIAVLPQLTHLDGKRVTAEEQSAAMEQTSTLHQKGQSTENAPCAHPVNAQARIFQTNQGKWKFKLSESEDKATTLLEIPIGKRVETSDILVNIQPTYLECTIEGKLLRLMLFEEVLPMSSTATRSTATGRLLLSMAKAESHDIVRSTPVDEASFLT